MSDLIERLRAFVVERGKLSCGSDIVSACNNSALRLADLRAILDALEAAREDAEAVERSPVVRFWLGDTSDSFVVNTPEESEAVQIGKHVRLLPAPPAIDAATAAEGRE